MRQDLQNDVNKVCNVIKNINPVCHLFTLLQTLHLALWGSWTFTTFFSRRWEVPWIPLTSRRTTPYRCCVFILAFCPEKRKIRILLTNCCAFLFQLSKFTKCGDIYIYIIGDILRGFLTVPANSPNEPPYSHLITYVPLVCNQRLTVVFPCAEIGLEKKDCLTRNTTLTMKKCIVRQVGF